jgi:hypothetical protein
MILVLFQNGDLKLGHPFLLKLKARQRGQCYQHVARAHNIDNYGGNITRYEINTYD